MIQINPRSPAFIQLLKYSIVAIISILIFSWVKSCSSGPVKPKTQTVIVPAKSGSFEPKKPDSKPLVVKENLKNEIKKDGTVYIPNPLNEKLLQENEQLKLDYSKMSDSLKSKTYEKAIELNTFSSRFEDKFMVLNINGTVRGEVQEITPSYTRKEFEIELKQKESVFRLLAGAEIGSSIITPKLNFKANLMFQNRKGDIISTSYDTNKNVWIGYNKSVFNIKR